MNHHPSAAALLGVVAGIACAPHNYESPLEPRYAGALAPTGRAAPRGAPQALRVVTFNIRFARNIDQAIALLQSSPALRTADIIALQEMDAPGTQRIAEALAMSYVYYPARFRPSSDRDFGNAVLSRWPIVADEKLVLPHRARVGRTGRIATAATILIGDVAVRVYSVHLGTPTEIGPGSRRDQVQAILADALAYARVVVGGDMNSRAIGKEFRAAGFLWPTEHNPDTHLLFNWDHIFLKGFAPEDSGHAGVVRDTLGASDHHPVWAVALLAAVATK